MWTVENKQHWKDAIAFSKKLGGESLLSFRHCMRLLSNMKKGGYKGYNLYLSPDWVKHSFYFCYRKENPDGTFVKGLDGGLILHGFQETFSVSLSDATHPYWTIHT